jgi:hypothetical protein
MTGKELDMAKVAEHRQHLDSLETTHLVDLWRAATERSWTAEGLEAIRQLLVERLGVVPPHEVPPPSPEESEEADTYHDPEKMLSISLTLNWLSWVFIVIAVLTGCAFLILLVATLLAMGPIPISAGDVAYRTAGVLPFLQTFVISISLAFLLRAFSEGLLVLMDIEDHTRPRAIGA